MKKAKKTITYKTEYTVLIIIIILSLTLLIGSYIHLKYFSFNRRVDDFITCTDELLTTPIKHVKKKCRLVDGQENIISFSYPQVISKDKKILAFNQNILNEVDAFKKNIIVEQYENYGVRYSYDYLIDYSLTSSNGILSIILEKVSYYGGIKKYPVQFVGDYINSNYELLKLEEFLSKFEINKKELDSKLKQAIKDLYFSEFEYSPPKESSDTVNHRVNRFINGFNSYSISGLYFNEKNELIGICNIPIPTVTGMYSTFYFNLTTEINYSKSALTI